MKSRDRLGISRLYRGVLYGMLGCRHWGGREFEYEISVSMCLA